VADAVGNIFLAVNSTQGRVLKFNSEGTFIGGTNESNISSTTDEVTLATNGESIYAVGSDANMNAYGKFTKFNNTLTTEVAKYSIGLQMRQDAYVDPTSCFVYVASVTRLRGAWDYYLGNPNAYTASSYRFSDNTINSGDRSKFLLYRVNNDMVLNAASSSCPTPTTYTDITTVSIAGNGDELSTYVHSGKDGWGDWRVKHSSASNEIEHTIPHVIDMSYGGDSQCVATPTGVQCKGYQGGGLGDAAETPNSTTYVTVDVLNSAMDVSVGSDFMCALIDNGTPYCWGNGQKGRIGDGGTTTRTKPVEVSTSTLFASIESGAKHTCALTSTGEMKCWGSNEEGQMAETVWVSGGGGTKSYKSPQDIAELTMAGATKFSKVSIGTDSLFTAALIDNGSIAVWGEYNGTVYTNHFILNSGDADDVAAGTDHICYIENAAVTCVGNNDDGQTTVPTMTKTPYTVAAGSSSTGKDWSCAGFTDGTYQCWGSKASW
jgi:alpha-tubulin suppressor-like RCC1 family protein